MSSVIPDGAVNVPKSSPWLTMLLEIVMLCAEAFVSSVILLPATYVTVSSPVATTSFCPVTEIVLNASDALPPPLLFTQA